MKKHSEVAAIVHALVSGVINTRTATVKLEKLMNDKWAEGHNAGVEQALDDKVDL